MSPSTASMPAAQATTIRMWDLAFAFQEVFTAVVRVRFGGQPVNNAEQFRAHLKQAMQLAQADARNNGYSAEDIQMAMFAVAAFIDESVLNSRNPAFADWARLPLQEELYGGHTAGEVFFRNLQIVLERLDASGTADLLEVYYLCLLLGYRGRYGAGGAGNLAAITAAVRDKMQRIRGGAMSLSPRFELPAEPPPVARTDPWMRRLAIAVGVIVILAGLLFTGMKFGLRSGVSELTNLAAQSRS